MNKTLKINYLIKISIGLSYRNKTFSYEREIELPFQPFYDLLLNIDDTSISLSNTNNSELDLKTKIIWNHKKQNFDIIITFLYKRDADDREITNVSNRFKNWKQTYNGNN